MEFFEQTRIDTKWHCIASICGSGFHKFPKDPCGNMNGFLMITYFGKKVKKYEQWAGSSAHRTDPRISSI